MKSYELSLDKTNFWTIFYKPDHCRKRGPSFKVGGRPPAGALLRNSLGESLRARRAFMWACPGYARAFLGSASQHRLVVLYMILPASGDTYKSAELKMLCTYYITFLYVVSMY